MNVLYPILISSGTPHFIHGFFLSDSCCSIIFWVVFWRTHCLTVCPFSFCPVWCLSIYDFWLPLPYFQDCFANYTLLMEDQLQRLPTGQWFSPGIPVTSTNKTDRYDIAKILLKVALSTLWPSISSIPDEGYSRSASCALNLIFMFLLDTLHPY